MTQEQYNAKLHMLSVSSATPEEKQEYKTQLDKRFFGSKKLAMEQIRLSQPDYSDIRNKENSDE